MALRIIDIHPHVISTDETRYPRAPLGGHQSDWSRERPVPYEKMIAAKSRQHPRDRAQQTAWLHLEVEPVFAFAHQAKEAGLGRQDYVAGSGRQQTTRGLNIAANGVNALPAISSAPDAARRQSVRQRPAGPATP